MDFHKKLVFLFFNHQIFIFEVLQDELFLLDLVVLELLGELRVEQELVWVLEVSVLEQELVLVDEVLLHELLVPDLNV